MSSARCVSPARSRFPASEDALKKICILLRDKTGHDFSQYKENTLLRRIERRMALHQIESQGDYVRYLQQDPVEIEALFRDLLIGVTSFFRDPEAFAYLQTEIVPRLFAGKSGGAPVRIWVCGCSTGEEAYSIAILLQEHLETLKRAFKVQVFATDVDPRAIEQARAGIYPASIAADVSAERLARFFSQESDDGDYRVRKVVRDLLIFSEQDLIRDPPFSRMDLICLPQPADLHERGPAEAADPPVPLCPEPGRGSLPRDLRDRRRCPDPVLALKPQVEALSPTGEPYGRPRPGPWRDTAACLVRPSPAGRRAHPEHRVRLERT